MKKIMVIIGFCLIGASGFPQQRGCDCSAEEDYEVRLQEGLIGFEYRVRVTDVDGIQYFNSWSPGEVMMESGDVIRNIYLRYNRYLDELLWLRQSDLKPGILKKDGISGFRIFNKTDLMTSLFIKRKIAVSKTDSADAYLHLLVPGDLSLFAYRNVIMKTDNFGLGDNTRYLIASGGGDYIVTLRRKSLLELPVIDKTQMKEILRTNRIAVENNEREFIRAVSIYNAVHR